MAGESHESQGWDVNVPLIVVVGLISTILLVVTVIGVQAWFRYEKNRELQVKVIETVDSELEALHQQQAARLGPQAPLPIEQAMDLVVQHYSQQQAERSPQASGS